LEDVREPCRHLSGGVFFAQIPLPVSLLVWWAITAIPPFHNLSEMFSGCRYRAPTATGTMRCSYGVPGHITNGCPGSVGSRGYP